MKKEIFIFMFLWICETVFAAPIDPAALNAARNAGNQMSKSAQKENLPDINNVVPQETLQDDIEALPQYNVAKKKKAPKHSSLKKHRENKAK